MLYSSSLLLLAFVHAAYSNPIIKDRSLDRRSTCPSSWTPYTAVPGDTCIDISNKARVPTLTLLDFDKSCTKICNVLQPQDTVCLPPACGVNGADAYLVKPGDSCAVIASNNHLTVDELVDHNPGIDCNSLQAGTTVCLNQPDGSNFPIATCPVSSTGTTETSPVQASQGPLAPGTAPDCSSYWTVTQGDICQVIATKSNITLDLFYNLNPNVTKPNCDDLMPGKRYCTGVKLPVTSTPLRSCAKVQKVQAGDTCLTVVGENKPLSLQNFYAMNPSVNTPTNSDCPNLQLGQYYCVELAT